MDFNDKLKYYQQIINTYLNNIIIAKDEQLKTIVESMRYSLMAGGKRIRPVLALGTAEIFKYPDEEILPYAAAVEMIHTYSLIHDDLPAMDNDDLRRGKPTNHKIYGEGIAVLAGDGLLNLAFEHMLEFSIHKKDLKYFNAIYEIANASGVNGMIGGQAVDILGSGRCASNEEINFMYSHKTGALIKAPVRAAAIISGASDKEIKVLTSYSESLGLAFQIIDDILDVKGDSKKLGKSTGVDASNDKTTYVSMYGVDKAAEIARALTKDALSSISYFGENAGFLHSLTLYLLNRDY